jgi:hypothetical protein
VRLHTGEPADLTRTRERGAASRYLVAGQRGVLEGIDGAELARRVAGVVEVEFEVESGDLVAPAASNLDLLGHVVAVADTTGDAARLAEVALGQLRPRITPKTVEADR